MGNIVLLIQTLYGVHTFVSFLHALVEDVLQPLPQRRHTYRQAFALRAHHGHQLAIQSVVGSHLDDLLVESPKQQRLRVREHGEHHRAHALQTAEYGHHLYPVIVIQRLITLLVYLFHPAGGHLPIVRNTPQQLHGTIVAGKFQHCLFFLVCHCLLIIMRCKDTLFYPNRQVFIRRIGYGYSCNHVTSALLSQVL